MRVSGEMIVNREAHGWFCLAEPAKSKGFPMPKDFFSEEFSRKISEFILAATNQDRINNIEAMKKSLSRKLSSIPYEIRNEFRNITHDFLIYLNACEKIFSLTLEERNWKEGFEALKTCAFPAAPILYHLRHLFFKESIIPDTLKEFNNCETLYEYYLEILKVDPEFNLAFAEIHAKKNMPNNDVLKARLYYVKAINLGIKSALEKYLKFVEEHQDDARVVSEFLDFTNTQTASIRILCEKQILGLKIPKHDFIISKFIRFTAAQCGVFKEACLQKIRKMSLSSEMMQFLISSGLHEHEKQEAGAIIIPATLFQQSTEMEIWYWIGAAQSEEEDSKTRSSLEKAAKVNVVCYAKEILKLVSANRLHTPLMIMMLECAIEVASAEKKTIPVAVQDRLEALKALSKKAISESSYVSKVASFFCPRASDENQSSQGPSLK